MADDGYGFTIEFADSGFTAEIIGASRSGRERKAIDSTHMTSTNGWGTFFPSDVKRAGQLTLQILYDPDEDIPLEEPAEEITITYPIPAGGSAGATEVVEGFIVTYDEEIPLEDRMTASVTVQFSGEPVRTPSS